MTKKMKFAFDVDGVITETPELYSVITAALKASGHSVYILTDFDEHFRQQRIDDLASMGIVYDELVITSKKEEFMRDNKIDFGFDDDCEYYGSLRAVHLFAIAGT